MRVLIAAHAVRMGGALQHLRGLLPALADAAPEHQWLVLTNPRTAAALSPLPERVRLQADASECLDPPRRFLFEQWLLAARARAFGAEVLLSFNSLAALGAPCPQVMVAANALALCPEYWRRLRALGLVDQAAARLRAAALRWSLGRASAVIVPSQWMAEALRQRFGLPPERLRVVHHGLAPMFFQAAADHAVDTASSSHAENRQCRADRGTPGSGMDTASSPHAENRSAGACPPPPRTQATGWGAGDKPPRYGGVQHSALRSVLAVSKHGINKDFATLVRATALLRERGAWDVYVYLTGRPSESPYARATAELIARLGLDERITFLGELSQAELACWHHQAEVFVFPSWCESFGLPQVEAAASGMAVIAPDLPVSRELLGHAARYYRPLDPQSLAGELAALLDDPAQARALGARAAERARAYTWARAAQATLAALEDVASHAGVVAG